MWTYDQALARANEIHAHAQALGYGDIKTKVSIKAWPSPASRGVVLAEGRCIWATADDGAERFYDDRVQALASEPTRVRIVELEKTEP